MGRAIHNDEDKHSLRCKGAVILQMDAGRLVPRSLAGVDGGSSPLGCLGSGSVCVASSPCLPAKVTLPATLKEISPIKSHGQSRSRRECLDKNTFRWPDMYPTSACSTPFRRAYGWPGSENTATNHENVYLNFPNPPSFLFP